MAARRDLGSASSGWHACRSIPSLLVVFLACGSESRSSSNASFIGASDDGRGAVCEALSSEQAVPFDASTWQQLAGRFALALTGGEGRAKDEFATGDLLLGPPPPSRQRVVPRPEMPHMVVEFLLVGWTDVDFQKLGLFEFAVAPSSTDSARPGVEMIEPGVIVVGAPFGSLDAGLALEVTSASERGFAGRWYDTGLRVPAANGTFCAARR